MTSTTAAQAVFNTAELLEAVLKELDFKSLFAARNVCKTWQLATNTSQTLRRMLYLEATEVQNLRYYSWQCSPFCRCFATSSRGAWSHLDKASYRAWWGPITINHIRVLENPVVPQTFEFPTRSELKLGKNYITKATVAQYKAVTSKKSSIRKMLISRPALRAITLEVDIRDCHNRSVWGRLGLLSVTNHAGVTIGNVFDAMQERFLQIVKADDRVTATIRGFYQEAKHDAMAWEAQERASTAGERFNRYIESNAQADRYSRCVHPPIGTPRGG